MKFTLGVLSCIHIILWSGYSVIEWLSNKDSFLAKSILLLMFFYLSYLIALTMMEKRKSAIIFSISSLITYVISYKVLLLFVLVWVWHIWDNRGIMIWKFVVFIKNMSNLYRSYKRVFNGYYLFFYLFSYHPNNVIYLNYYDQLINYVIQMGIDELNVL